MIWEGEWQWEGLGCSAEFFAQSKAFVKTLAGLCLCYATNGDVGMCIRGDEKGTGFCPL